ncbi:MAG: hypothetical protein U0R19_30270 [Bryobacteraceae bacterium]
MLFVGEAPPASGRFFYRGDSGLYRAMLEAFSSVDDTIEEGAFLDRFRDCGCYLVDLCPAPVDGLDREARRAACGESEGRLSRIFRRLQPAVIVTVVRSIEGNVERAAALAAWKGEWVRVPYPGRWAHLKRRFIEGLEPILLRVASKQVG